jgi:hypothetical protein
MAGEIYIADKATLDSVKADTNIIKSDTAIIKAGLGSGATFGDTLPTTAANLSDVILTLTGKYELLGFVNMTSTGKQVAIQIDGSANRKLMWLAPYSYNNVSYGGFKCTASMVVSSTAGSTSISTVYKLLP